MELTVDLKHLTPRLLRLFHVLPRITIGFFGSRLTKCTYPRSIFASVPYP